MSEVYKSFFDGPNDIFKQTLRTFGRKFTYKHIEEVTNAVRVKNGPKKNSNMGLVAFPLDSDDFREAECFAVFTTSKNNRSPYKKPVIYRSRLQIKTNSSDKYPHLEGGNCHPMYIPEQERKIYKGKLMESLRILLIGLSKKKTEDILSGF